MVMSDVDRMLGPFKLPYRIGFQENLSLKSLLFWYVHWENGYYLPVTGYILRPGGSIKLTLWKVVTASQQLRNILESVLVNILPPFPR
jgi:hypothetical protein